MTNRTNLVIKTIDSLTDKTSTTTITYVNPNATNEQLIQLADALVGLTADSKKQYIKDSREVLGNYA